MDNNVFRGALVAACVGSLLAWTAIVALTVLGGHAAIFN
jgi:hypothetical protein